MSDENQQPVFRFAPSPNGELHLGHAYSALLNYDMMQKLGGRLLLRIEDIDITRCTPLFEEKLMENLRWLGIDWDDEPRRQSERFGEYQNALNGLKERGLIYPAFMSRGERNHYIAKNSNEDNIWPIDPDGAPLYPDVDRLLNEDERQAIIHSGKPYAWRLDMKAALQEIDIRMDFQETGLGPDGEAGPVVCEPALWGDVLLGRKEIPTSYHLSVVIDDALQNVSHVVRGQDLFHATSVHRLLQQLLGISPPVYHHHELILANDGRKLSKSLGDTSLNSFRKLGATPDDIRNMVGLARDQ